MNDDDEKYLKAKQLAYASLSYRSYLSKDLLQKLLDKEVELEVAERVIIDCRALGYLDDEAWIQGFVKRQVDRRDGPQKIAAKLRNKGINLEEATDAFDQLCTEEVQLQQIQQLMETRYRQRDLTDPREKSKVIASLMRKGYHYRMISSFLSTWAGKKLD